MANMNHPNNRFSAEIKLNENIASDTQKAPHKMADSRESEFNPVSPARAYGKKRKEIPMLASKPPPPSRMHWNPFPKR